MHPNTVELAGDITVIDDRIADALLTILKRKDLSGKLRARAAITMGPVLEYVDMDGFDDPEDVSISKEMFHKIQNTFHTLYQDLTVPKYVRRRVLEASVRAPQNWHHEAIRWAFSSNDPDWRLTAVFSMRWVRGFNDQILQALESDDPDIYYQGVCAAGNWTLDGAWSHVSKLVKGRVSDKRLLLAAIEAIANIRPREAAMLLLDLTDDEDDDIVEAAHEALVIAEGFVDFDEDV